MKTSERAMSIVLPTGTPGFGTVKSSAVQPCGVGYLRTKLRLRGPGHWPIRQGLSPGPNCSDSKKFTPRRPHQELGTLRRSNPTIVRPHHLLSHARIILNVIQLIESGDGEVHVDIRQVLADTVPWSVAERARHVAHVWRRVQPALRSKFVRVGEDLRIPRRRVG